MNNNQRIACSAKGTFEIFRHPYEVVKNSILKHFEYIFSLFVLSQSELTELNWQR